MKGKEQQEDTENEFGIAWFGNSINFVCKFDGAVDNGTIFISTSTYSALSCTFRYWWQTKIGERWDIQGR